MSEITLHLTAENIATTLKPGDIIVGAEYLGPVRSARATNDGLDNGFIYGERDKDRIGLPQTLTVRRDAPS